MLELTLVDFDKNGKEIRKRTKIFENGDSLYDWARKERPQWKFELEFPKTEK
jgi:hypothetical protein